MKVYIPSTYDNRPVWDPGEFQVVIPLSGRTADLPQDFAERKTGNGNTICHVKTLSAKLFTSSGIPILWGWKSGNVSAHHLRQYFHAYYKYRLAVYSTVEYITDTPGQSVNGSQYRWKVWVTSEQESGGRLQRLEGYHQFGVQISRTSKASPGKLARDWGMKLNNLSQVLEDYLATHVSFPHYTFNESPDDSVLLRIFSEGINYYLNTFLAYDAPQRYLGRYEWKAYITAKTQVRLPSGSLFSKLRLDEYNLVFEEAYSAQPFAAYHIKALQQAAYLDCLDHVPQMNENNIANIIECVQLLKGIIIDHKVDIPDSLSSLWLSYRYTYGTGKSDMEDAIRFQKRVVDNAMFQQGFTCYGAANDIISDVNVTCRCRITFRQKELEYLDKISTALYRYGLSPSFYVIWDLIPYSFVVDWFLPIGDILSASDKRRMYDRTYDMLDIWFSLKYEIQDDEGTYTAYTRWLSSDLPEFRGYYTLENIGTPSQKTIGFRILDALSLIFR